MKENMERLLEIMATLRSPNGCPWDREQTHQSIRPQLIEECYELVEAIESANDAEMKEELGDLLLHVVFHCQLAAERGAFRFDDVVETISQKLVRRHPHVFATEQVKDSAHVIQKWEEIKKQEKPERTSNLDGVPKAAPALIQAQETQKKAARVGFDWKEPEPVLAKIREELEEIEKAVADRGALEEEIGDLLFAVVNLARHYQIDAEQACRLSTAKFTKRFHWIEKRMIEEKKDWALASLDDLDHYWNEAKQTMA